MTIDVFKRCQRCGRECTCFRMSMFNTQMICSECKNKEMRHVLYQQAVEAEHEHTIRGDFNYEGIGLPDDLKEQ